MYKKIITFILFILLSNTLYADKLAEVKKKGFMLAGVKADFEPFGFRDKYGNLIGFDIDLSKYIAKKLGIKVKYKVVTSKTRINLLEKDYIDIVIATMTHNVKRDKRIDYTISYFFDGLAILTTKYVKVNHHFGFNGKKVGMIAGSTSGVTFKRKVYKARMVEFESYDAALNALAIGKIDAITTDMVWCKQVAGKSEGKLRVLDKKLSDEPYGMGIASNESNFRDAVNFAIQDAVRDGSYTKYYNKWFHENPPKLPETWPVK